MPGRFTVVLILAFFVGMFSWQYSRQYGATLGNGPQLKPSLELAAQDGTTAWKILFNGERLGDAQTQVVKTANGIYILRQAVLLDGDLESFMGPFASIAKLTGIKLNDFRINILTEIELTYLGTMKKLNLNFFARPKAAIVLPGSPEEKKLMQIKSDKDDNNNLLRLSVAAEVQEHEYLTFKGSFNLAGYKYPLDEMKVRYSSKESIFSKLSPTDCLAGIRLGQRWQTPMIDPTQLMMSAYASSKMKDIANSPINVDELTKTKSVEVRVLDELKETEWAGKKYVCYVVQSNEKASKMQLWVNVSNNRVLKQVYESDRSLLEMIREPKKEE